MRRGLWVLKFIVFAVVMVILFTFITMSLWNWLVPVLFNGPVISFAQTLGLLILSKIFLWTFNKHHHGAHNGGPWKRYWKEKWNRLSPEEKEELKRKMRSRWCKTNPEDTLGNMGGTNV